MNHWLLWKDLETKVKYKIKIKWENIKTSFKANIENTDSNLLTKEQIGSNFITQSNFIKMLYFTNNFLNNI